MTAAGSRDAPPRGVVAFDVDGVLLRGLFLWDLMRRRGLAVWLRSARLGLLHKLGFLSVREVVERAYALLAGSTMCELCAAADSLQLVRGADTVCRELSRLGYVVVLVSVGVPQEVVERLAQRLGAAGGRGPLLEQREGILTGRVLGERHSERGKRESLEGMLSDLGFPWTTTTVVVDDRSNREIVKASWRSIGVNPEHPILKEATFVLQTLDLSDILQFFPEGLESGITVERVAVRHEALRKAIHACAAVIPAIALWSRGFALWLVGAVTALFIVSEIFRLFGIAVPAFSAVTRATMRPTEPRRVVLGPIAYGVGILAALAFFPRPGATVGILVLAIGDSLAAVAGRAFGSAPLPHNPGKTLVGSLSLFLIGVITATFFVPVPWALAIGGVAAVVESLPLGALDNLLLPVATAAATTLARAVG